MNDTTDAKPATTELSYEQLAIALAAEARKLLAIDQESLRHTRWAALQQAGGRLAQLATDARQLGNVMHGYDITAEALNVAIRKLVRIREIIENHSGGVSGEYVAEKIAEVLDD